MYRWTIVIAPEAAAATNDAKIAAKSDAKSIEREHPEIL
jgi:hypothetical protein